MRLWSGAPWARVGAVRVRDVLDAMFSDVMRNDPVAVPVARALSAVAARVEGA